MDKNTGQLPEGVEWLLEVWPKWSNGEYCRFGDKARDLVRRTKALAGRDA